jgi:hypothetical protein
MIEQITTHFVHINYFGSKKVTARNNILAQTNPHDDAVLVLRAI